jgi:hypothetical protein
MDQKETFRKRLVSQLPATMKARDYLMQKLNISKEAAYRRIRGDIPFTFEEIVNMAWDLGFSIDEIAGRKGEYSFPGIPENPDTDDTFLNLLQNYYSYICMVGDRTNSKKDIFISMSRLTLFFLIEYDQLFKFFYYKWSHRINERNTFSQTYISNDILKLQGEIKSRIPHFYPLNFVINQDLFLNTILEIEYFHNCQLLSETEVFLLKEELTKLLGTLDQQMKNDRENTFQQKRFYLSLLNLNNDSICSAFNQETISLYWLYAWKVIVLEEPEAQSLHKKWFESMKKSSALISGSNEILQINFINKQREYIHKLNVEKPTGE